ncbi:hypothetical protein EG68_07356 [Paragonimus skrjabini miyazakii]|uniref:Uncharacterized protein n=1 Tax=Paragonimus skrjabini miyazakii TaxID=59628 RepID=A0A8S9YY44_9TREM|nr:hypothetical protein EG68_07356 [Paragonimus skrjabini miyazakii]
MMPPNVSLVKYDTPILVTKNLDKKSAKAKSLKGIPQTTDCSAIPCPPSKGKPCSGIEQKASQQTEEILNSILPPREWTENGQLWIQHVSSTPATRLDVVNLQEELDRRLQQRQARETGICPVRRELYNQVFDELIRQVTINCAERGLLLLRVRDEIRMTIAAYQTLYESNVHTLRTALKFQINLWSIGIAHEEIVVIGSVTLKFLRHRDLLRSNRPTENTHHLITPDSRPGTG